MYGLTLWQPHATLVAILVKSIETRGWAAPQSLIGQRIFIHAAVRKPASEFVARHFSFELQVGDYDIALTDSNEWILKHTRDDNGDHGQRFPLPLGVVVCTARLAGCLPMVAAGEGTPDGWPSDWPLLEVTDDHLWHWPSDGAPSIEASDLSDQLPYGDFAPGRFGWMLEDVEPLVAPIEATGKQRLWTMELAS